MKNEPVKKLKKIAYPIAIATAVAVAATSLSACSLFKNVPERLEGSTADPAVTSVYDDAVLAGAPAVDESYIDDDEEVYEVGVPAVPEGQIDLVGEDDDCSSALDCPDGETSDGECVSSDAEQ